MTPADTRRMVSIVRAIRAGKWTNDLPDWVKRAQTHTVSGHWKLLQEDADNTSTDLRAVQTAEAFIILGVATDATFNVEQFLYDCGFTVK